MGALAAITTVAALGGIFQGTELVGKQASKALSTPGNLRNKARDPQIQALSRK